MSNSTIFFRGLNETSFSMLLYKCGISLGTAKLMPSQVNGLEFMLDTLVTQGQRGAILGHDMGLGKSVQALIVALLLRNTQWAPNCAGLPILILCPKTIKISWLEQYRKFCRKSKVSILVVDGPKSCRSSWDDFETDRAGVPTATDIEMHDIVLAHYDGLKSEFTRATRHLWEEAAAQRHLRETPFGSFEQDTSKLDPRYDWTTSRNKTFGTCRDILKTPHVTERCTHLQDVITHKYGTIIYDESHRMKNPTTAMAFFCNALRREKALLLSGTPIQNDTCEIWTQMRVCGAEGLMDYKTIRRDRLLVRKFERREREANAQFGGDAKAMEKWHDGQSHTMQYRCYRVLTDLLDKYMMKITKKQLAEEVSTDAQLLQFAKRYPGATMLRAPIRDTIAGCWLHRVEVQMTPEERAAYIQVQNDQVQRFQDNLEKERTGASVHWSRHVFSTIQHLRQAAVVPLDGEEPPSKFKEVHRYFVEKVNPREKMIVFCHYVRPIGLLHNWLQQEHGIDSCVLYGDQDSAEREAAVREFVDGDPRIIIVSFGVGNVGLNLERANHVLFLTGDWNVALMQQAIDRAHRYGQRRDVHAVYLMAANSIDQKVDAIAERKRGHINMTSKDIRCLAFYLHDQKEGGTKRRASAINCT